MGSKTRVVVTGIGVVSSIGIGTERFWKNLIAGKSGISRITGLDTKGFRTHRGGEIKNFKPQQFIEYHDKVGRSSQFLVAATKIAIKNARLDLSGFEPSKRGVMVGISALEPKAQEEITRVWVTKGVKRITHSMVVMASARACSAVAGYEFRLGGLNMIIPTACSAGNYAIGYGYDLLRSGQLKIAFCCGSEAFSRTIFAGFNRLFAVAPDKCSPFDKNRQGMITAEGAAVLILETLDGALKRKANIYAEVLGYGLSCDASSMTVPSKEGIKKVMERAIRNARVRKEDIDYISAHGTGTINNDRAESAAIREMFGPLADKIPVSSIKSMLGHTLGAGSSMEAAGCCLSIRDNVIPPTINFKTPDPECNINVVANKALRKKVDIALNNSFAFGGNNAAVVFGRFKK